jgi:hypothetical protein
LGPGSSPTNASNYPFRRLQDRRKWRRLLLRDHYKNRRGTDRICGYIQEPCGGSQGVKGADLQARMRSSDVSSTSCHAEGRGFEPLQPLLSEVPASSRVLRLSSSATGRVLGRMEARRSLRPRRPRAGRRSSLGTCVRWRPLMRIRRILGFDRAVPLDPQSIHSQFGDGLDGRRQIGSTPAGRRRWID